MTVTLSRPCNYANVNPSIRGYKFDERLVEARKLSQLPLFKLSFMLAAGEQLALCRSSFHSSSVFSP
jgi:hypothetical protein